MENERRNLSLHDGSVGVGGLYNEVKINDNSKIDGDINCILLKCSDGSTINGNIEAQDVCINDGSYVAGNISSKDIKIKDSSRVNGSIKTITAKINDGSKVYGDINAEDTIIRDGTIIDGNVTSKTIHAHDGSKITGNVKGEEIKINDSVKIGKDCECEKFTGSDSFQIGGLLNAEEISITLDGNCSIKEIGGNNISVRIPKNLNSMSVFGIGIIRANIGIGYLTADTIEGDTIYLENTNAKIVRGSNITIGNYCSIGRVEYKENFTAVKKAIVIEQLKID